MKVLGLALMAMASLACAQPRPQMAAAEAAQHTMAHYLAQGAPAWTPAALGDSASWRADFVVAADGSGTHRTLQAAIDAVPARSADARRYFLQIKPGHYREVVCLRDKAPLTLYGSAADPAAVVVVEGRYNALPKRAGIDAAQACHPELAAATHGTPGSSSLWVASDDVVLAHFTVANDAMERVHDGIGYPEGAGEAGGAQAVALTLQGDRIQLDDMRLVGHQDTLYVRRKDDHSASRMLVRASLIAGDVDFVFGNATLVIDDSSLLSRGGRRAPGSVGHVLAPSTAPDVPLGMLVQRSRFIGQSGLLPGTVSIGRAWDTGVAPGAYRAGVSPNGQALVRDSMLGPHIGPWRASTSRRPFSATGADANRMAEFNNRPVDPAHQVLAADDGWAAAEGGTSGGAAALSGDVFEVRDRAQLAAALSTQRVPGHRPRIVKLFGRIDLSVDDSGRPLGYEDYRDPAFDFARFTHEYDPATWGKKPPEGPLEQARRRSARAQAERVVLRVPPNTTLVGVGPDAALVHGNLLLERVDNVIVRNIHFSDAYDHFPAWDPNDNASGEWNSEYDNITLRGATHVWVDHCTFDDGARPDQAEPIALGRRVQHHDGLLDIIRQSSLITLSWNHFHDHDKTMLIGNSDNQSADAGKLAVSLHHNLWQRVRERTPRVRFGQVHVYNNLFIASAESAYGYGYSLGVGHQSRIFSERNVWETSQAIKPEQLIRLWKGNAFFDRESLHNGKPVDLLAAMQTANPGTAIAADVGWQPRLAAGMDAVGDVADKVREGAGAGHIAGPAD